MKCGLLTPGLITLLTALSFAQEPAKIPAFEAADVHVSAPGASGDRRIGSDGRLEFHGATLLGLVSFAYSLQPERVTGGPSWVDVDHYDVIAKTAPGTPQQTMRTMLQDLLAERFGLSVKKDEQPQPVYALVLGKHGPKESNGESDSECKRAQEEGMNTLTCRHTTMTMLADQLPRSAPAYFDRPIVDRTGLKGAYDFKISWVGRGALPPGPEGKSLHLFTSIEKQLDVKVETLTEKMPVLAIEKVNRTPSPNPPGAVEALGPAPTEFEVAEIKPSRPDEKEDFNVRNGRIDARAITLRDLIGFAYDVDEDDMVRGGEKWIETDHYNILAKTEPSASADTFRVMLRSLLADRFKLKVHKEPQAVSVYALTASKPKLKEADPAERTTCKSGAVDGARYLTCQNTTMAQFAEKIRHSAGGYLDHPVVDLTGLKGAYDFTVTWSPVGVTRAGGAARAVSVAREGGTGPGDSTSSDPTGGLTVFQAVERQLGLKLAPQKHPMPVVVVDHIERLPTEN